MYAVKLFLFLTLSLNYSILEVTKEDPVYFHRKAKSGKEPKSKSGKSDAQSKSGKSEAQSKSGKSETQSKSDESEAQSKTSKYSKKQDENGLASILKEVKFHPEPSNPLVFTIAKSDGSSVALYGDKDENGNLLQLTGARIVNIDGTMSYAEYDHKGRPLHILSPNGDLFNIDWQTIMKRGQADTRMTMEYMSSDETSQVIGTADLNDAQNSTETNSFIVSLTDDRKRRRKHIEKVQEEGVSRQLSANYGTYTLRNRKCGALIDDDMIPIRGFLDVMLTSQSGDTHGTLLNSYYPGLVQLYPFRQTNEGTYVAKFPVIMEDLGSLALRGMCREATFAISTGCTLFSQMDISAWTAMCFQIIMKSPSLPAAKAAAACELAYPVAWGLCNGGVLGTPMVGPDSLAQNLCDLIEIDKPITAAKVDTCFKAYSPLAAPGYKISACAPDSTKTAYPPNFQTLWDFDAKDAPTLFSVKVVPPDPSPGQSISVTAKFGCVSGEVRIHVIGTDGYEDEITCGDLDGSISTCTLDIDGAAADVKYVITYYYDEGWFSWEKKWPRKTVVVVNGN
eukprot:scaffold29451_cov38-Cyclotella_meneghiniana.AAC.3